MDEYKAILPEDGQPLEAEPGWIHPLQTEGPEDGPPDPGDENEPGGENPPPGEENPPPEDENPPPEEENPPPDEENPPPEEENQPPAPEPPAFYHVFTRKGLNYLAKQQMGALPQITRAEAGAGFVDFSLLESQELVRDPVGDMEIGERRLLDDSVVQVPLRLANTKLASTALIRQVGVYAMDPDEGEILYQLVQYQHPQPLPSLAANKEVTAFFDCEINLIFANGEAASIPVSPGWFLSRGDLDAHDGDPQAHGGAFPRLSGRLDGMEESFRASQEAQDTRIKLLEDTLITDIQDNKKIIVFGGLADIRLVQGVHNAALSRLEC